MTQEQIQRYNVVLGDQATLDMFDKQIKALKQLQPCYGGRTVNEVYDLLWEQYSETEEQLLSRFE